MRATVMVNVSEVQRIVCRHNWQCVAEWAGALGELADLTDDQIDGLARSDQQRDTFSPVTNPKWLPGAIRGRLSQKGKVASGRALP
jgi:hypothetical protein